MTNRILEPIARLARSAFSRLVPSPPVMGWMEFSRQEDFDRFRASAAGEFVRRAGVSRALQSNDHQFTVPGYCWVCGRESRFNVTYEYAYYVDGVLTPNWREHLRCPRCDLISRVRATVHFLEERILSQLKSPSIYITEQNTPLYRLLASRYSKVVGSEYLGDAVAFGQKNANGFRNESLTRLTFDANTFDCVVALEVLEHIPVYGRALEEIRRVLRPGGFLMLSVPFLPGDYDTLVRATVEDDGTIKFLLPPEYHGDPVQDAGCLAYYQFGWDILEHLRGAGFVGVCAIPVWSEQFAYLADNLFFFIARKNA